MFLDQQVSEMRSEKRTFTVKPLFFFLFLLFLNIGLTSFVAGFIFFYQVLVRKLLSMSWMIKVVQCIGVITETCYRVSILLMLFINS